MRPRAHAGSSILLGVILMENQENTQIQASEAQSSLPPKITKENIDPLAGSKRGEIIQWVKAIIGMFLSSILIAVSSYSLIAPNNFTVGGIAGIAILLNAGFGLQQSIGVVLLNAPLIVLSFFYVKKRFAILSTLNIIFQTIWLTLLENCFPDFQIAFEGNADRIFAAIAAALCFGTAIVFALKVGGSTGGGDILAVLIQKKLAAGSIAWILFGINSVVITASFFVFYDGSQAIAINILPIMLSIFEAYVESKVNESLTNGFQSAIEFRIITDKPEEMSVAIMKELGRGVTSLPATGMYSKMTHSMLVCVISRRQIATLKRLMKRIDPDAFAVMSNVSQVFGLGFHAGD